jgi:hypothetical protein
LPAHLLVEVVRLKPRRRQDVLRRNCPGGLSVVHLAKPAPPASGCTIAGTALSLLA